MGRVTARDRKTPLGYRPPEFCRPHATLPATPLPSSLRDDTSPKGGGKSRLPLWGPLRAGGTLPSSRPSRQARRCHAIGVTEGARVILAPARLTRQEPLGSLQNSHFAYAKPRFLRLGFYPWPDWAGKSLCTPCAGILRATSSMREAFPLEKGDSQGGLRPPWERKRKIPLPLQ